MLEFRAAVESRDLARMEAALAPDADGLLTQLVVMVRPLSGLMALAEAMAERLGVPS